MQSVLLCLKIPNVDHLCNEFLSLRVPTFTFQIWNVCFAFVFVLLTKQKILTESACSISICKNNKNDWYLWVIFRSVLFCTHHTVADMENYHQILKEGECSDLPKNATIQFAVSKCSVFVIFIGSVLGPYTETECQEAHFNMPGLKNTLFCIKQSVSVMILMTYTVEG